MDERAENRISLSRHAWGRRDKKGVFKSKQYFFYPCIKYEYLIELLDF